MAGLGYTSGLLVAAVLLWAAATKLRDPRGTAVAFRQLGVPAPRALALLVPVAEIAVALALALRPVAGAVAALVLLAAFSGLLATKVRRGEALDCACFGSSPRRPVSSLELVRNALLGVAAAAALTAGSPVRPPLEALITVTTAAASALVAFALVDLRRTTGGIWRNHLPRGPEEGDQ